MSCFIILTIVEFYQLLFFAIKVILEIPGAGDKAGPISLLFSVPLPMTLHGALGEDNKKTYANVITSDMVWNQYKCCKLFWPQIEVLHAPQDPPSLFPHHYRLESQAQVGYVIWY